jgi:hypothetical protein
MLGSAPCASSKRGFDVAGRGRRKNGVSPVRSTHGRPNDEDEAPLVRVFASARVRVRTGGEQPLDQRERFLANAAIVAVAA